MTMSPTAVRTARRNLVQRIDRFVKRIQTDGLHPGPDAIANFEVALECLERALSRRRGRDDRGRIWLPTNLN
jgi:hypothetical protein